MKITFFPYDFKYKVEGTITYVYLYGKKEDNTQIIVKHAHQPFFYVSLEKIDVMGLKEKLHGFKKDDARVISFETEKKNLIGKTQRFLKVYVNYPKAVPIIAKEIEKWGPTCYERDILFIHRYLRDNNITPMTKVEAEGEFQENIFIANTLTQIDDTVPKFKILSLDIETYAEKKEINPERNPILMIGLYGVDEENNVFEKVITWRQFDHNLDYLEIVGSEEELLSRFADILTEYNPDIITGYYTDGFDFPYINTRAQKLGVPLKVGKDTSGIQIHSRPRNTEAKITGYLHLDVLKFVRNIFGGNLKTDSYSLDSVAHELLGHQKHVVNLDLLPHAWYEEPDKLAEFVEYNLHDARLTYNLCKKLLFDMIEFTKIIGLPSHDVIRMRFSRLVESYIMKRGTEFNIIAPNKPGNEEIELRMRESIQGAFVYEPTPGIYDDIVVFDFRSLYPTIISAHNLGPGSYRKDGCKNPKEVPERPEYWFCEDEKSFLPTVLENLIIKREAVKKEIKEKPNEKKMLEARSYALKILGNSFYGYLAFYGARWYSFESAGATTAYARDYIKRTIKSAEEHEFEVVYSDTDSCFLLLKDKFHKDAMNFMDKVNKTLPGRMELEFEGYFPRGIFVAQKGTQKGAKKKYALIREDGSMKITGFETVRRNWSTLAKDVQQEVLRLVLNGEEDNAITYVKKILNKLKEGNIPFADLILRTQITRKLSDYASIGPHVRVAQRLAERGEKIVPGMVVEYIVEKGKGSVGDRARLLDEVSEYDVDYYLKNQIIPAVESILSLLGYTGNDLISGTKQQGLGQFF